MNTHEMVDSVNALSFVDRSVVIEDILKQQRISVDAAHNIVNYDFGFSKESCWVTKTLKSENVASHCKKNNGTLVSSFD